jgi:hypothetical protein
VNAIAYECNRSPSACRVRAFGTINPPVWLLPCWRLITRRALCGLPFSAGSCLGELCLGGVYLGGQACGTGSSTRGAAPWR